MALETTIWLFCLLALFCGPSQQEKLVSVELSCGAGPSHVVLEPSSRLLLECDLGASDSPFNISWFKDGRALPAEGTDYLQFMVNQSLLLQTAFTDGKPPRHVEGSYNCVSASTRGALTSRTVNVLLASLSRFHKKPSPQTVPTGGTARFECQIEGIPTPVIAWEKDGTAITNEIRFISLPNGVLQILEVTEKDEGSYRCVASNSAGREISDEALLTVTVGPDEALGPLVIVARPQNVTVVLGQPAVMECMAQGLPKPIVSWSRKDKKPMSTDVAVLATNLVIRNTRRHHAGVYVCRANKNMTNDFINASAELHVSASPVILHHPESVSLSRGNTARFHCNSSGEPSPVLRWLKNGQPVKTFRRVKIQSPGVLLINQLSLEDGGYYQCIADNGLGTACATAMLMVTVKEGVPSPPRHLSVTPHSSTTALLTWEKPENNSNQVIGYSLHYLLAAGSDNMEYQFVMNNETTEYLVKELLPHTAYVFFVTAYSHGGSSGPSENVTVEMLEDVPSAPPQLSIDSSSPTDIRLMWHPLSSQHSRGAVTRYRIEYSTLDQKNTIFSVEVKGNETQFTLRELQPNQIYRLRIAAGTAVGFGIPSEWAQYQTLVQNGPSNQSIVIFAPTELRVQARGKALNVTWHPSPNHTLVSGYKLSYREIESDATNKRGRTSHTIRLRKKARSHLLTGLVADRQYEVRVWAFIKHRDGAAAVWKGKTEKENQQNSFPPVHPPPLPPSSIQATVNSSTSIWLRWEKPRFSNVRIINYTVRCSPAGISNTSLVSYHTSSAHDILIGGLKPFTRYELAVQSNGVALGGPFSATVEESTLPDRPSTPPDKLQLSALNSTTVLVSWRPPLEANGIIISYNVLYSCNLSEPEQMWNNFCLNGGVTNLKVPNLSAGTHYYFKVAASTDMGPGPFTSVKAVQTPLPKFAELDTHAVIGIIVGICLGLVCILLCLCFSLSKRKSRDAPSALNSTAASPQYRRVGFTIPVNMTECHELDILMPPSNQESIQPLTEVQEEESLMATANSELGKDLPGPESKAAWNGSISHNWVNRITRYRDTITEDSPSMFNGVFNVFLTPAGLGADSHLGASLCSNQVEAEVIVHSELSNPSREDEGSEGDSSTAKGPSLSEDICCPVSLESSLEDEEPRGNSLLPESPSYTRLKTLMPNQNRETNVTGHQPAAEAEPLQDSGLTNGFHSPNAKRSMLRPEHLENGDSKHQSCAAERAIPSGFAHSTSTTQTYLCP